MSTVRQKKLAPEVVKNLQSPNPKPIGQVLKSVGYGTGLQNQPKRVLESEGFKEEMAILGFDVETAKRVVGQIALEGENDNVKLKASEMIFKVHGTFAPDKSLNVNIDITQDERLDDLIAQIEHGLDNSEGTTLSS